MKKRILMIGIVLGITACGQMYEHKHLDGMWQLRHITYEDGSDEQLNNLYFGFQMHTVNIRRVSIGERFGTFDYIDDSLYVCFKGTKKEKMLIYGMNDTIQHFKVEKLDRNKLILKSNFARLEFRNY